MKKVFEFIKPFLAIILGALMFLYFLNWLGYREGALAIGIIAVIFSSYYMALGILGVVLGDKLGKIKKVLDIVAIGLFPLFMFVYFLIITISMAEYYGPNGWVLAITSMVGCLGMLVMYLLASLAENSAMKKLVSLFAAIFVLVLLLNILFDVQGNPNVLGNIDIILFVIYIIYSSMLFVSVAALSEKKAEAAPAEEEPKEETPVEEKPAEEEPKEE